MAEHPIQGIMNVTMDKIHLTDGSNSVDRALAMLPELVEKVSALVSKKGEKPADEAPKAE